MRIAMVVANAVLSDTRVLKAARTTADAGHEVVVLGYSPSGARTDEDLAGFRVVRLPLVDLPRPVRVVMGLLGGVWSRLSRAVPPLRPVERRLRLAHSLRRGDLLSRISVRLRAFTPAGRRMTWARDHPVVARLEPRCRRELASVQPELIHAHDVTGLGLVGRYVAERRKAGDRVTLVYDAHEHVRGMTNLPAGRLRGAIAIEDAYLPLADRIVTVSPQVAEAIQRDHGLAAAPEVVLNVPWRRGRAPRRTLRQELALEPDVPLLVYPGNVKPIRGLTTVVDALPALEGVHLALVADATPHVAELIDRAAALACTGRLHVVPYVAPEEVSSFIADATAGVNPLLRYANADVALPNKIFEYLHAGLPMIVSDTLAVRALVERLGVGEVHTADDPPAFVAAARKVLDDPAGYRLAPARRGVLDELSWERQAEILLRVYDRG